jgi:hypothetical protein
MTSHPKLLKHKKTMKYDVRNPDAGLEQAQVVSILLRLIICGLNCYSKGILKHVGEIKINSCTMSK